ncbi:MAG TPA: MBL fold metallo-hydrolase [Alphaproteobacteria bacterium]|nr:MBL fold metallo-hydrolase [Alphaproteobacteria bacterium]
MIDLSKDALSYPFPETPPEGTMLEVAPGIHWVRMPLPFALDHVNLWLIEDGDGWTMIDTGLADDRTRANWRTVLKGPAAGRAVARLLATHFHPDHAGLAGWFQEETGAPLLMSRVEWLTGRMLSIADDAAAGDAGAFFRSQGLAAEKADGMTRRGNVYRQRVTPLPPVYQRLAEGDVVQIGGRPWRVMIGTGHAPEHVCLYCEPLNVLIAGDQILPRITPNVSVHWYEPLANPLAGFLASSERFAKLPKDVLVLPSHGKPFRGLRQRLAGLEHHHAERLAEVAAACAEPRTAADLLPVLFRRPLDDHQLAFAMGEAVAHLAYLAEDGTLIRHRDREGVFRFQAVRP